MITLYCSKVQTHNSISFSRLSYTRGLQLSIVSWRQWSLRRLRPSVDYARENRKPRGALFKEFLGLVEWSQAKEAYKSVPTNPNAFAKYELVSSGSSVIHRSHVRNRESFLIAWKFYSKSIFRYFPLFALTKVRSGILIISSLLFANYPIFYYDYFDCETVELLIKGAPI